MPQISTISVSKFKNMVNDGSPIIIDVRTPKEFQSFHLNGAINLPLGEVTYSKLQQEMGEPTDGTETVYILCHSGKRAEAAAIKLSGESPASFVVVEGGSVACDAAGMDIIRSDTKISLERQIRLVAGGLALIGLGLGVYANTDYYALTALVSADLMFAGITDNSALKLILERMPWNAS